MTTQFTTLDEAKTVVKQLGAIGGGIAPFDSDNSETSGIYIPEYAVGPFQTPQDGERKFFHLRFRNGVDGFNAGLVKATMAIFPTRWPLMISTEVDAAGRMHFND
jgi:hypothetical protein